MSVGIWLTRQIAPLWSKINRGDCEICVLASVQIPSLLTAITNKSGLVSGPLPGQPTDENGKDEGGRSSPALSK